MTTGIIRSLKAENERERRRMATKTDTLTPQQAAAADLLAFGATVTDAAETVKVSRQTVSEWLHHNAAFQAALHARQRELWQGHVERLRSLVPKAMDTLEAAVSDEQQGVAVAVHILKAAGLYGLPAPSGSIHIDAIESAELTRQMVSAW
jgi:4-alpha-glucanotransferase